MGKFLAVTIVMYQDVPSISELSKEVKSRKKALEQLEIDRDWVERHQAVGRNMVIIEQRIVEITYKIPQVG